MSHNLQSKTILASGSGGMPLTHFWVWHMVWGTRFPVRWCQSLSCLSALLMLVKTPAVQMDIVPVGGSVSLSIGLNCCASTSAPVNWSFCVASLLIFGELNTPRLRFAAPLTLLALKSSWMRTRRVRCALPWWQCGFLGHLHYKIHVPGAVNCTNLLEFYDAAVVAHEFVQGYNRTCWVWDQ